MLSRTKKILLTLFLSVFLLANFSTSFVHAQTWYNQPYDEWYEKVYDTDSPTEIFGERYTHAQVQWIIYSLVAILTGVDDDLQHCIAENNGLTNNCYGEFAVAACNITASAAPELIDSPMQAFCAGVGVIVNIISFDNTQVQYQNLNNPLLTTLSSNPVSSIAYFKDVQSRLKLVPEAKAQGYGFTAASPMLNLWRQVRNFTYFLLVIVIIVMAFMIMFRTRISPQTVITVQSALPKIVMALILITFSYAIAGFLIDLMYVVIGLLAAVLTGAGGISTYDWGDMFNALTERGLFSYFFLYWFWFMPMMFGALFSSGWFGATVGVAIAGMFSLIILLVLAIYLLVIQIKTAWLLFRTFVIVLLLVVLGPIQILVGTLTGGGFGRWLRTIVSHLAVYPTVGFMLVLSFVFLRGAYSQMGFLDDLLDLLYPLNIQQQFPSGGAWEPPLTFGSSALELGYLGASVVILSMIPKAGKMMQGFIAGGRFDMGSEIGRAIGIPMGVATTPISAPLRYTTGAMSEGVQREIGQRAGDSIRSYLNKVTKKSN